MGVRLPLTHPDFLGMLNSYAELCGNTDLTQSVARLNKLSESKSTLSGKGSNSKIEFFKSSGFKNIESAS